MLDDDESNVVKFSVSCVLFCVGCMVAVGAVFPNKAVLYVYLMVLASVFVAIVFFFLANVIDAVRTKRLHKAQRIIREENAKVREENQYQAELSKLYEKVERLIRSDIAQLTKVDVDMESICNSNSVLISEIKSGYSELIKDKA